MKRLFAAILAALLTAGPGMAGETAKIDVERERVNGQWHITCSTTRPAEPQAVAEVGEKLRSRCKREADSFASRQHVSSGSLLRAKVGPVETNETKTVLTVTAKLIAG